MATLAVGGTTVFDGAALQSGVTGTLGSGITFPAGHVIRVSEYDIGSGAISQDQFPEDTSVPQNDEGTEIFTGDYTPSTGSCNLRLQAVVHLLESSNTSGEMAMAVFVSGQSDAIMATSTTLFGNYSDGWEDAGMHTIDILFPSWGTTEKTFSLRQHGGNAYNSLRLPSSTSITYWKPAMTSKFFITEIAT